MMAENFCDSELASILSTDRDGEADDNNRFSIAYSFATILWGDYSLTGSFIFAIEVNSAPILHEMNVKYSLTK